MSFDGKWGYVDSTGAIRVQPQFDGAGPFSRGLATVAVSESHNFNNRPDVLCSVIDQTGTVVIALRPGQFPHEFSSGVSQVDVCSGGTVYIDTTGRVISQEE